MARGVENGPVRRRPSRGSSVRVPLWSIGDRTEQVDNVVHALHTGLHALNVGVDLCGRCRGAGGGRGGRVDSYSEPTQGGGRVVRGGERGVRFNDAMGAARTLVLFIPDPVLAEPPVVISDKRRVLECRRLFYNMTP